MRAVVLLGAVALIAGGLWWYLQADRGAPSGMVATVDVPGDYSICAVGLSGSRQDVPCGDVGRYLRDALKLGSEVGVLIRPRDNSGRESRQAMTEQVHAAGYMIQPYMGGISPEVVHGDR